MPREWGVIPMTGSIKGLLVRASCIGQFDLVYTAGAYDYLPDGLAVLLTKRMLELVKPGGEFLFANFSTEVIPAGYMETFMNWSLIFRDEAQMRKIARAALGDGDEMDIFFGENRHIVYARIRCGDRPDCRCPSQTAADFKTRAVSGLGFRRILTASTLSCACRI
tara:strand:+ start:1173 stop:1667 length:495 start_codon:yes stop_codon:yes gene_type:complete